MVAVGLPAEVGFGGRVRCDCSAPDLSSRSLLASRWYRFALRITRSWCKAGDCKRICSAAPRCWARVSLETWNAIWSGTRQHTLQRTVQQFANREHLAGLAVYDPQGHPIAVTTNLEPLMASAPAIVLQALKQNQDASAFLRMGSASIHIYALPLHRGDDLIGSLAIVHDSGYIRGESLRIWRETFLSALAHVVLIVLITLLIVRWSIAGPIARTAVLDEGVAHGARRGADSSAGSGDVSSAGAGSGDVCREPEHGPLGGGAGGSLARERRVHVDGRPARGARSRPAGRRQTVRGLEPRTLHAHPAREIGRSQRSGQRPGDRDRARASRLRWNLGRARIRRRRSGNGGRA